MSVLAWAAKGEVCAMEISEHGKKKYYEAGG